MPIPVKCPHCGAAYPVADDLGGRTLLCKECDRPVAVQARRKRSPLRLAVRAAVVVLAVLPGATLGALWWTGWLWDFVDWPTFRDPDLTRPDPRLGNPGPVVTLHVAGIERSGRWQDVSEDLKYLADDGHFSFLTFTTQGDRATVLLAPVSDPEAFARRIDFGTVCRVSGRVVTVSLADGEATDPLTKALSDLSSDNVHRRTDAVLRLQRMPPDPRRREEVARALEARLNDPDRLARRFAVEALGRWGTRESVAPLLGALGDEETSRFAVGALRRLHRAGELPDERRGEVARALEALLDIPDHLARAEVIALLGRLKDEGSIGPLARRLEDFFDCDRAGAALRAFGPAAEKAVAERLRHKDFQVRNEACRVLKDIGTPASLPALRALKDDFHSDRDALEAIRAIIARDVAGKGD